MIMNEPLNMGKSSSSEKTRLPYYRKLKEQYPVTAHAPNFDFRIGCEIKRCDASERTLKNPFASRLAEFNITLKLLRITDQLYIVPVKFRFRRNQDFWRYFYCRWPEDQRMGSASLRHHEPQRSGS